MVGLRAKIATISARASSIPLPRGRPIFKRAAAAGHIMLKALRACSARSLAASALAIFASFAFDFLAARAFSHNCQLR